MPTLRSLGLATLLAAATAGCNSKKQSIAAAASSTTTGDFGAPAASGSPDGVDTTELVTGGPILAAKGLFVLIRSKPSPDADKIGYLRLGGQVQRDPDPVGASGCPGGWYKVYPKGYACLDKDGTLEPTDPIVTAASRRPDLSKPMPYAYGFVRAVLPFYLKVPSSKEQEDSEFKLADHLKWWEEEGREFNRVKKLGANDVFIDALGVPDDSRKIARLSTDMSEGELFGGKTNEDPPPVWLQGGRKIPNVAEFKVPDTAIFADRARRFSGLTFVASFPTGPESGQRRFAVTEDLRLAPTSKVKPDMGPTFHGVAVTGDLALPFAWIKREDAKRYQVEGTTVRPFKKRADYREIVKLTGKKSMIDKRLYYEVSDGKWVRARDIAIATEPDTFPKDAERGEKWIDISIRQQVLSLWEGKRCVYATMVSTGQDMLGDPKTTKSTVLGSFRIYGKHATTHMDSTEGLTKDTNDPEYGKSKRRGQGTFLLQNVPWVQYFKGSYALHATYWHDVFGTARSHGCVNLTPIDAHHVFFWTHPTLPKGWHASFATDEEPGTLVFIHE